MTVRWTAEARSELANIWLRADSAQRRAISAAAHAIDRRLAINPDNEGESRSAGCYSNGRLESCFGSIKAERWFA